jgi:cell division protein FtsZ
MGNFSYSEVSQIKYSQGDLKKISIPEYNFCKKYIREYTSGFGIIGRMPVKKIRGVAMESLVQEVFERSFKENEKKEEEESETVQEQPKQEQPTYADFSASEDTAKSIQDEFGLDVKEAKIVVLGIGGAGNNCITRLSEMGVKGATTLAVNTDAKHLSVSKADEKLLVGRELTRGLGAGGYPDVGKRAVEESEKDIKKLLEGTDMIYMVTGLGGGTGTGGAPVMARIAKELGCIVIGCTTMPFKIEGARIGKAEDGLYELRQVCDTVIVIENDRLLKVAGDLPLQQAFGVADNLISTIIKGVTETIAMPSLVNLDYADVKTIMHSGGVAAVGFGESDTKNRAEEAVVKAMSNPLLEVNYDGGLGALIHITGGEDLKLDEVNLIGEYVSKQLDPDAQVIWGARINQDFKGKLRVITIITGVKSPYILGPIAREETQKKDFSQELGIPIVTQA